MADRWRHERTNLNELDADEDGVQRGRVEQWWRGDASYPRRDDPHVWIEAIRGPDGGRDGWTYFVEDGWNLADREQHMTREDAVQDGRGRVERYKDRAD